MKFERLAIPDLVLVEPKRHGDPRGFFSETFREDAIASSGIVAHFVQDNHVVSNQRGVLRGLHFQKPPRAQGKLVRCSRGAILDVGVDIRQGSPTFGRYVAVELSAKNWRQLWVPPGFAHGYLTLEDDCEVIYKVTDYYAPECDSGIAWDDPDIGIDWGVSPDSVILSDKDRRQPLLKVAEVAFNYDV